MKRILLSACRGPVLALQVALWLLTILVTLATDALFAVLAAVDDCLTRADDRLRVMARKET